MEPKTGKVFISKKEKKNRETFLFFLACVNRSCYSAGDGCQLYFYCLAIPVVLLNRNIFCFRFGILLGVSNLRPSSREAIEHKWTQCHCYKQYCSQSWAHFNSPQREVLISVFMLMQEAEANERPKPKRRREEEAACESNITIARSERNIYEYNLKLVLLFGPASHVPPTGSSRCQMRLCFATFFLVDMHAYRKHHFLFMAHSTWDVLLVVLRSTPSMSSVHPAWPGDG